MNENHAMAKQKKTWREKVDEIEQKIHVITPEWQKRYGKGKLLIAKATDIEKLIRKTRPGQLLHNDLLREKLAKDKKVQVTDPITIGIFLRIIAEAAEEEKELNKAKITPYWRVLKPDGSINIKLPGGEKQQVSLLKSEGHKIEKGKGKKPPKVKDFETKLKKFR